MSYPLCYNSGAVMYKKDDKCINKLAGQTWPIRLRSRTVAKRGKPVGSPIQGLYRFVPPKKEKFWFCNQHSRASAKVNRSRLLQFVAGRFTWLQLKGQKNKYFFDDQEYHLSFESRPNSPKDELPSCGCVRNLV